jgi:D-alanyl-D-alanine dipeptidase
MTLSDGVRVQETPVFVAAKHPTRPDDGAAATRHRSRHRETIADARSAQRAHRTLGADDARWPLVLRRVIDPYAGGVAEIVLMGDDRVATIPVVENGEGLVDLRSLGVLGLDSRKADPDGSYAHLRSGLVRRLEKAQALLPAGVELLVLEGFRPVALQQRYFSEYEEDLRRLHPHLSASEIARLASRYVSPPEIAPHSTGAALDLTLRTTDGAELDLGTRVNASPEESEGRCYADAADLSPTARANREVLTAALSAANVVNYPTEWWHWSYGDRYWALVTDSPHALYGPTELARTGCDDARMTQSGGGPTGDPVNGR